MGEVVAVADTVPSLLADLARAHVRLRLLDDGRIEVSSTGGPLSAELGARIRRLKPELVAWLAPAGTTGAGVPIVRSEPGHAYAPFPPSDLQTSFLVGATEGLEYHVRPHQYMEFEYDDLDPARFEKALNLALRRQQRNLVVVGDDLRLHAVPDPEPVRIRVSDLRGLPEDATRERLHAIREAMQRRELPLDRWPWMDVEISRYGAGRARLHYNNNNFFSDAFGTMSLLNAVLHYYRRPGDELPELDATYRDCLLALAEVEDSPRGQAARRYWNERVPRWPGAPAIPLVSGAETRVRSRLHRRNMYFGAEQWAAIKAGAAERGLTATSVLCAAYAEVIAYWSGSRHFLLNNMVNRRLTLHPPQPEVIGNFAALYPLEVDWRPDEPFAARARRLQAQVAADLDHLQWSGVQVLQELNRVSRSPGRAACPFAVGSALSAGGAHIPSYSLLETPQTLLDCEFWETGDGRLWVIWDVIEAMFPDGLIDAMRTGFETMLDRLGADPRAWEEHAFDLLPAVQRAERDEVNRTAAARPDATLHGALPERAARAPARPAVIAGGTTLTYARLHARVGDLARRLQACGVRSGDRVAVILPKGWQQPVAVLSVLTAGAAYVPIDPDWPAERIGHLLRDTGARAILAGRSGQGPGGVPMLAVDEEPAAAPAAPVPADPDALAYVIYTSGSTGRPKGVMIDHRGAVNTIADINRQHAIGADDVVFGISSLCFDLSVYDIFGTLDAGATLVLPDASRREPADWLDLARTHGVTVWNSVPTLMQLLVEEAHAAGLTLPALRVVLLSGDWIPVDLPARIASVAPSAQVISLGGATEASIWSIAYPIDAAPPGWATVPYGRPLANQTWHVLDESGRDAPLWTSGHLHIGGRGLALGYLGDAGRTAAAFVTHPRTGERLYRTGDLGRYRPGGDIELLGRADFQVKIHGYRVEPGEIEHALLACPGVAQAAVVARDVAQGKQLAGFVVADPGGPAPAPARLRAALSARLPAYLVPDTVTVLDRLPSGANGKVDRRALTRLAAEPDHPPYTMARTSVERALVAIWEEVLGHTPVGVHDDFFDLGGHSLAGLRAMRLLTHRLGRRVALGALLRRPTVAGFAGWLASADPGASPLSWLHDAGDDPPWYFVHPAGGTTLCYSALARSLGTRFGAFEAALAGDGPVPDTVEAIARSYRDALRATRPGPYRLGGWSSGAVIAYEMARQLRECGETVTDLVVVDAPAPYGPQAVADGEIAAWFAEDLGHQQPGLIDGTGLNPMLELTLEVFTRIVRACAGYRPAVLDVDILVLRAADGQVTEFATHPARDEPDWGWSALTTGRVIAVTAPGTHHTMVGPPHVAALADIITAHTGARAGATDPAG